MLESRKIVCVFCFAVCHQRLSLLSSLMRLEAANFLNELLWNSIEIAESGVLNTPRSQAEIWGLSWKLFNEKHLESHFALSALRRTLHCFSAFNLEVLWMCVKVISIIKKSWIAFKFTIPLMSRSLRHSSVSWIERIFEMQFGFSFERPFQVDIINLDTGGTIHVERRSTFQCQPVQSHPGDHVIRMMRSLQPLGLWSSTLTIKMYIQLKGN